MKQMYDWENDFPQITNEFHNKICEVLHELPEEERCCRMSKRKYVVAIAIGVMMISTITVYAAVRWNQRALDNFSANDQQQEKLSKDGYSSQIVQSVSDNDITISVEQTIQDENLIYILFKITSDNLQLTENNAMGFNIKATNGPDFYTSMSSGFVDEFLQPDISNSREYEIWIQKNTDYDFTEAELSVDFNALQEYEGKAGPTNDLVKGQWDFSINLSTNNSVTFDVNKTVSIDGCDIAINKIELSPLSYTIYCDGDDVMALQKADNINFDELDITYPLIISAIQYKDATEIQEDDGLMSESFDGEGKEYIATGKFSKVIDMNQIQAIMFGDKKVSLSIY